MRIPAISLLCMLGTLPGMQQAVAGDSTQLPPHISILAASCAACHGTNGNSVGGTPVLAGLDPTHFVTQMRAFRTGERRATVMHQHAKGLTPDEIDQLAIFFSQQKRVPAYMPQPQALEVSGHDD